MMASMSVIKLEHISKIYGFGEAATMAVDQVNLEIKKGEFVAIMGPSGSGKSTLMNIIGLLDRPTSGIYELDGKDIAYQSQKKRALIRREKIGFVFQSFNLLPRLTAIDNVALPLTYSGLGHVERMEKAANMLKRVGLEDRQYYMPNQLSGGQVQRVAIARALVNDPALVLADEPTGNLDTTTGESVIEVMKELHKGGNTIVMITHDQRVADHAERTISMIDGTIESDKPKKKKTKKSKTDKKEKKAKKKKTTKKSKSAKKSKSSKKAGKS